jgi:hypothetical protein
MKKWFTLCVVLLVGIAALIGCTANTKQQEASNGMVKLTMGTGYGFKRNGDDITFFYRGLELASGRFNTYPQSTDCHAGYKEYPERAYALGEGNGFKYVIQELPYDCWPPVYSIIIQYSETEFIELQTTKPSMAQNMLYALSITVQ